MKNDAERFAHRLNFFHNPDSQFTQVVALDQRAKLRQGQGGHRAKGNVAPHLYPYLATDRFMYGGVEACIGEEF